MVWDYNDRTPTLRPPAAARLRFTPPKILGSYNIPHAIWGDDASICHEVPTHVWNVMQILVPKTHLERAATCLVNCLSVFSRQTTFPPNKEIAGLSRCYLDDCIVLASSKPLRTTADYIILIPDEIFHFDVTNPASVQAPPKSFGLPDEFDKVGVPSFSSLLNALLYCSENFSSSDEKTTSDVRRRIYVQLVTLVAWRWREPWEELYNSPEEYPIKLREIRDCLSPESVPIFDRIHTKPQH
ncbi:hypothetical protein TWF281_002730 [Arthrobotrys megalospora]